jgi:peptidoglycan/xylan/chitin deacetylase (PgdA/CDA1 family)
MFDSEAMRNLVLHAARLSGAASLARRYLGGTGAILMLHRVTASASPAAGLNRHLTIAPDFLDRLIGELRRAGYEFVSMDGAVERLERGGKGPHFAAITADDAYRDNLTEALPILERHGTPLTIYVAPGLIDGTTDLWWDLVDDAVAAADRIDLPAAGGTVSLDCSSPAKKREAGEYLIGHFLRAVAEEERGPLVRQLVASVGLDFRRRRLETLMTWDELARIAAHPLVTIGAHTVHHYNLRRLPEEQALREMVGSADILEARLGRRPVHFAYPYGYPAAVGEREVRLAAQAGFVTAVTTRHGVLRAGHVRHLHALPRISVNGRYQRAEHVRTMMTGVTTPLANSGRLLVTV